MSKVITLTTEASKRLIAKAVMQMPEVQRAYNFGYIALALGTTCGFIVEELCGYEIEHSRYCCKYISSKGPCILSAEERIGVTLFIHGEMITTRANNSSGDYNEVFQTYLNEMGPLDVYIKSGTVMDSAGKVACLAKEKYNGAQGNNYYIPEEVFSIIPMTISKTIPGSVEDVIEAFRKEKITKRCNAEPSDMVKLNGALITEVEAAKSLLGVDILPIAMGGFGTNRSSTTFLLSGEDDIVENAYCYLSGLKSEPELVEIQNRDCRVCPAYALSS